MNSNKNHISTCAWKTPELPTYLFIYLLVGLLAVPRSFLLDDLDVCWLIRTGELIWQTGHLPTTDVFSFTHQGKPWILYQWGFELFLGGLHLIAGLGGVVWGGALLIALAYSLLFHFLLGIGIHRAICIGLVVLTMLINSFHWLCRPNTASILFYIFLLIFLEGYRRFPGHRIWFLPLLFSLWANVHLGFTSGLLVLLVYSLWSKLHPKSFSDKGKSKDNRLLAVFFICLLATLANPYGPKLFAYLWELSRASTMNARIGELHSPNFHSPLLFSFIFQIVLIFWFGNRSYSGRNLFLTVMCITIFMGLYSVRHIPYFSIPATIHLAYSWKASNHLPNPSFPSKPLSMGWGWGGIGAMICLVWVIAIFQWNPNFYDFDEERIPYGASKYLEKVTDKNNPSRIFTTGGGAQWNDYFIYRLYPRVRVFIDTRFDMYGDIFFKNYLTLVENLRCDLKNIEAWEIDYLIFQRKEKKDEIDNNLVNPIGPPSAEPPWVVVYEDEQAFVYRNMSNIK